ncbi:hypothetical protein [Bythopirellula polymerisocia]|uniref:hypothetical protein n=1 Tax=Bythopirellula polymerisocia TaxID=2528003 RepID=UPI0011B37514|nr:hypothetical protein [Bythopirellula polymerisocia]
MSRENYLAFKPLLPEVIGGTVQMLPKISPIRRIVPEAALRVRAVQAKDLAGGSLALEPGYIPRIHHLKFDHLVLAGESNPHSDCGRHCAGRTASSLEFSTLCEGTREVAGQRVIAGG